MRINGSAGHRFVVGVKHHTGDPLVGAHQLNGLKFEAIGGGIGRRHIPPFLPEAFGRDINGVLAARGQCLDLESAFGVRPDGRPQVGSDALGMEPELGLGVGEGFAVRISDMASEN